MSNIRRQSLISSVVVYFGFALGFLNTYLFTREGGFTEQQYGLTGTFIAIANIMFSFANLGSLAYIYKFFPYYKDTLPPSKNDMLAWSLLASISGFVLIMLSGLFFKDLVIRKFSQNSPELVKYYYWVFPFGFGLTIYSLLEALAWQFKKAVLTSFLREVLFRLLTTALIILSFAGIIDNFDLFIKLYAFTYIAIALILFIYLIVTKKAHLHFSVSTLTRRLYKKVLTYTTFLWGGSMIFMIAQMIDTLIIGSVVEGGMAFVGVYTLAQNVASLVQAPQRGIIAASLGPLSQAWKDKNIEFINRIYHRTSINQLIFAVGMFTLIWLNFTDGVLTFKLKPSYLAARDVFLYIGLMRIIDLGTGVNAQIIATSMYWRFEFLTGIILLALALPLNYLLAKHYGVTGPAISNLIAFTIYNAIRYFFLLKRYNMQPFTAKSLYAILLGIAGYTLCYFLFDQHQGFWWIVLRSITFLVFYGGAVLLLKLTPDILQVWGTVKQRLRKA
ncbi:MAG: polysaccharide biosynthesis C-terminal domain-containing protein [Chitinophagaceae bacterium]